MGCSRKRAKEATSSCSSGRSQMYISLTYSYLVLRSADSSGGSLTGGSSGGPGVRINCGKIFADIIIQFLLPVIQHGSHVFHLSDYSHWKEHINTNPHTLAKSVLFSAYWLISFFDIWKSQTLALFALDFIVFVSQTLTALLCSKVLSSLSFPSSFLPPFFFFPPFFFPGILRWLTQVADDKSKVSYILCHKRFFCITLKVLHVLTDLSWLF